MFFTRNLCFFIKFTIFLAVLHGAVMCGNAHATEPHIWTLNFQVKSLEPEFSPPPVGTNLSAFWINPVTHQRLQGDITNESLSVQTGSDGVFRSANLLRIVSKRVPANGIERIQVDWDCSEISPQVPIRIIPVGTDLQEPILGQYLTTINHYTVLTPTSCQTQVFTLKASHMVHLEDSTMARGFDLIVLAGPLQKTAVLYACMNSSDGKLTFTGSFISQDRPGDPNNIRWDNTSSVWVKTETLASEKIIGSTGSGGFLFARSVDIPSITSDTLFELIIKRKFALEHHIRNVKLGFNIFGTTPVGDYIEDNMIDLLDLSQIKKDYLAQRHPTDFDCFSGVPCGDTNGDGMVDDLDVKAFSLYFGLSAPYTEELPLTP